MFQKFDVLSTPDLAAARIARLREQFDRLGVDAVVVPRADEYLGEYVPECAERLAWLTGFTGSAGQAMIFRDSAHLFVDGRYTAQARSQTDPQVFDVEDLVENPPHTFIRKAGRENFRLGIDPWTFTSSETRRLEAAMEAVGGELVTLEDNPVDMVWDDRPAEPLEPVAIQPLDYAGRKVDDKLEEMRKAIAGKKAGAAVLSDPSSVAWTFNIRGSDLPSTPHPLSRAILPVAGRPTLYIDERKLGIEARAYLTQLADIMPPESFDEALANLGRDKAAVMIDPAVAPHAIALRVVRAGGSIVEAPDPARLPRAIKNDAEINASASVHKQDGAAMVRFLCWFDSEAPKGGLDEITATSKLEDFRATTGAEMQMPLKALSFDTIAGAGPNAAIIHYRVNTRTNRPIKPGEMFLVDSGGQYVSGTTDITRTIAVGEVPGEQKRFFTLVLKGMIAVSRLRFPKGTRGLEIDPFARHALWQAGADYGHGTGHGVGSFLAVHEGPQSISRRGEQALFPGMIVSNEPGYYRDGGFGIRIENLIYVTQQEEIEGGDRPMLGFETLTLCPIDRRLIVRDLMAEDEIAWLDAYHARVRDEISPLLMHQDDRAWLETATAPL
ncbi:aminopeptidase P family protein [Pseudohoeflea suaedae]|uniref:Aminopeptidase P family protein n=1 Tax=Pseudohoeflea suaedae TaxID=877384 RepID=A0A4R5PH61_9HYPH|nr:aminopeptidase P family protein [Pseudohoeflea suaedae]TDH34237.1 aminopeptidase P family protein [Pseudohoeflea suaedae]